MIGLKFILEIRKKFNHLLDDDSRKKYSLILFLSIVNAILELVGVSLLLYTILAIFEPDFIEKFQLTAKLSLSNLIIRNCSLATALEAFYFSVSLFYMFFTYSTIDTFSP